MQDVLELQIRPQPRELSPRALAAFSRLDPYDWIVFTSKHAVKFFFRELHARRAQLPTAARIAAVGPETARALEAAGVSAGFVPARFTAGDLFAGLPIVPGMRILYPCSARASRVPLRLVRSRGARVVTLPLYTTVALALSVRAKRELLAHSYASLYAKSPSAIEGLLRQLTARERAIVRAIPIACIGPTTAEAARAAGFTAISLA